MVVTPYIKIFGAVMADGVKSVTVVDNIDDESDSLTLDCEFSTAMIGLPLPVVAYGGYQEGMMWPFGVYLLQSVETHPIGERLTFTSASFSAAMKKKRNKSYQKLTIKDLVAKIAKRNGLSPKCDMKQKLEHVDQRGESDMALLKRYAEKYNAIFNVKNGVLIFLSKTTEMLPHFVITADQATTWSLKNSSRPLFKAVKAVYHDTKKNKKEEVKVGGGSPEYLHNVHAKNKGEAKDLARAKLEKLLAKTRTGTVTVEGQNLVAGGKVLLLGFGKGSGYYLITKAEHKLTDVYTTTIEVEMAV